jgi:hypothetical protein
MKMTDLVQTKLAPGHSFPWSGSVSMSIGKGKSEERSNLRARLPARELEELTGTYVILRIFSFLVLCQNPRRS